MTIKLTKETLKRAISLCEAQSRAQSRAQYKSLEQDEETLEKLMADALTSKEADALEARLKTSYIDREFLREAIADGVFEGTPFETARRFDPILYPQPKTASDPLAPSVAKPLRSIARNPQWIAVAALIAVCALVAITVERGGRSKEIALARAELDAKLNDMEFDDFAKQSASSLVAQGYSFQGERLMKGSDESSAPNSEIDALYEALGKLDSSDALREERARFALVEERDPERARAELSRIKNWTPERNALMGTIEFMCGNYDAALQCYRDARTANPDDETLAINEAICQMKLGRVEDARAIYRSVRDKTTNSWRKEEIDDFLKALDNAQ